MPKIRVFIVDDSAIVREILTERLSRHPSIEVVGSAMDPYIARDKLDKIDVDVLTLDIEMPRMDGLTFLRQLMKHYPKPVIVVSSLARDGNAAALQALELGAVDVVPKPGGAVTVDEVVDTLIDRILAASKADLSRLAETSRKLKQIPRDQGAKKYLTSIETTNRLIAVGASTGGTVALETLFLGWEPDFPPTLTVIHMPEKFTASFASRLNDMCRVRIKEAEDGERIMPGTVYFAPGGYHMILRTKGTERTLKIATGPKVCNQRPAVDPLFESVADQVGRNCLGILLTGMGRDGAQGLLRIHEAGGHTIAQDEETSVVWGMPKEAIELGAADKIMALDRIAPYVRTKV